MFNTEAEKNLTVRGTSRNLPTLAFLALCALAFSILPSSPPAHASSNDPYPLVPQSEEQVKLTFAPVVKAATPAVVNIYAERVVNQRLSPFMNDPFFSQLFGQSYSFGIPQKRVERSLGSGVIVSEEGLIVTNTHVIEDAEEIRIILNDRREFPAEILVQDEQTDLAILKILNNKDVSFPVLSLGQSDSLEVGDIVLAIGNPFGVGQTVTSGIVSATARTANGITDYGYFIQTDAAINPGNSGGALVDVNGKLVGINTAIYSRSGGSLGIGFAIPVDMVKTVINATASGKKVVRPWLGVEVQTVTSELAESLAMERPAGVIIRNLHKSSPLKQAGLKVGDIIIQVGGQSIDSPEALEYRIGMRSIGTKANISYLRKGELGVRQVKLIAPPENPPRNETKLESAGPLSGLTIANLSPAVAEQIGMSGENDEGVVVIDSESAGRRRYGALKVGDILRTINGKEIKSVEDVQEALKRSRGRWVLQIQRGNRMFALAIR